MIFSCLTEEEKILSEDSNISISIGIACFPRDGQTLEDLYQKADSELYKVKRNEKGDYSIAE